MVRATGRAALIGAGFRGTGADIIVSGSTAITGLADRIEALQLTS